MSHTADNRAPTAPPAWPKTEQPLRIALFGWARLSHQGAQGSGYNLSASELAAGLSMSGHSVFYLCSGRRYNLWPGMFIAPTEVWRGVECSDLFNSPNISPASYNFQNMRAETHHPRQTGLILSWLARNRIEVVHIHSLEGFPLESIGAMRDAGMPVIVTPHNYWYACPQVDLMQEEVRLCRDFEGGRKCSACIRSKSAAAARMKRRLGHPLESIVGNSVSGLLRRAAKEVPQRVREVLRRSVAATPNSRQPDPEVGAGFVIRHEDASSGLIHHNFVAEPGDGKRRPVGATAIDENERFLAADHHLTVLNDYGQRRLDGMAALNRASMVIPPSDFVRRVYVRMGLSESRSRVVRLGQPHFDQINRRARRSPFYEARPWDPRAATRPLRFGFFGAMRPSKGIDVLVEAITLLTPDVRQRCQFHIRAQGYDWPLRKKLSLYPEVSFAGGYDLIQLIGAGGEYDVGLLPHVWFENSPLVLLEHLHAGKFVICSRLGGPVEWVTPPRNGLMVAGGHPEELAVAISRLVNGEVAIPSPREIHEATPILRSYPDHIREVESTYREALGEASTNVVQVRPRTLTSSAAAL